MNTTILASGVENPQQFQNVGECIKTTEHFSNTVYQNVCDGTSYIVQNGFWDYCGLLLLASLGIAILGLFSAMIFGLISDSI